MSTDPRVASFFFQIYFLTINNVYLKICISWLEILRKNPYY